ncbi:MAG: hypothetical protein WCK49_08620 [Myxococcaceae bacterium]
MSTFLTQTRKVELQKRYLFMGTGGLGLLLTVFSSSILGIPILALGTYFGLKWFQFRAKNGMRF